MDLRMYIEAGRASDEQSTKENSPPAVMVACEMRVTHD
jgi:hypothetical protein